MSQRKWNCAVIAIAGGSGAGKSMFAGLLAQALGSANVTLISQDDYYQDLSGLPPARRDAVNFDDPAAVDFALLAAHLRALRTGHAVPKPCYDFHTHTRARETRLTAPRPFLLVEGILVLYPPELRELYTLTVFVDAPDVLRFERRLARDTLERGRSPESVRRQYETTVRPMYERYVAPCRKSAGMVVNGAGPFEPAVETIVEWLEALRASWGASGGVS